MLNLLNYFVMKRKLIVSSLEQATGMIKSFLAANALPLREDLNVMFGWFVRDMENDDEVGCPCFVCDYATYTGNVKTNNILIYVKIFANKDLNVTKFYQISSDRRIFFDVLHDGDTFDMKDVLKRFPEQHFVYKDGKISEVE